MVQFSELSIYASQSPALQVILGLALLLSVRWLYYRSTWRSISYLPGPKKSDWLFGNLTDLNFNEVGFFHVPWQKEYGHSFKMHGLLGEHYLMTSDPKAIQHIYTNPDSFVRQTNIRELLALLMGPGLTVVSGDAHRRQRRVMQPAFALPHLKALFPIFSHHAEKLSINMKKDIDAGIGRRKSTIDVYRYAAGVTLDIVGEAALDYQFGALDNKQDRLRKLLHESHISYGNETKLQLLFQYGMERLPSELIVPLSYLPIMKFFRLRVAGGNIARIAGQIVQDKVDVLAKGLEGGKDLMTRLIRANANQKQSERLSDREVISEIATIIVAGYETTANSLSFALWELAKNIDMQRSLREEIREVLRRVQDNGKTEIGFDEYETMPLLVAFMKELLRFHPNGFSGGREATEDSVIPLSHPVKLESGEIVNEVPVSKGQRIWVNFPGYNRLPDFFGEDADEFNIYRWMRNKEVPERGVGIYANLITFAHGPRSCIGWRFSMLEMQMVLIELVSIFEFSLPANGDLVRRTPALNVMIPTIKGERNSQAALMLDVSIVED